MPSILKLQVKHFSTIKMIEGLIENILNYDQHALLAVNSLHSPYWDLFMFSVSGKLIWIPLYASILLLLLRNFSYKAVLFSLLTIGVMMLITDTLTAQWIRPMIGRMRPSNLDCPIGHLVHTVNNYRGGAYGFPSNHAGNCFGLAFFICFLLRKRWLSVFMIGWAAVVCYSRMYLGVHYPGDILGGITFALIGSALVYRTLLYIEGPYHRCQLKGTLIPVWVGLGIFTYIAIASFVMYLMA